MGLINGLVITVFRVPDLIGTLAMDLVYRSQHKYPYRKLAGPCFPLTVEGVTAALESLEKRESTRPIIAVIS